MTCTPEEPLEPGPIVEFDIRFATVREKTKDLMRDGRAMCGMSSVQPVQRYSMYNIRQA